MILTTGMEELNEGYERYLKGKETNKKRRAGQAKENQLSFNQMGREKMREPRFVDYQGGCVHTSF